MERCSKCGSKIRGRTIYSPTGSMLCAWCNDQFVGLVMGLEQNNLGVAIAAAGANPRSAGPNGILAWIRKALGRDQR